MDDQNELQSCYCPNTYCNNLAAKVDLLQLVTQRCEIIYRLDVLLVTQQKLK